MSDEMRRMMMIVENSTNISPGGYSGAQLSKIGCLGGYDIGDLNLSPRSIDARLNRLRKAAATGTITIHRCMSVPQEFVDGLRPGAKLGVYWSYDSKGVGLYGDNSGRPNVDDGINVVLHGRVSADDVLWDETIAGNLWNPHECEIKVRAGAPIRLTGLTVLKDATTRDFGQLEIQVNPRRSLPVVGEFIA